MFKKNVEDMTTEELEEELKALRADSREITQTRRVEAKKRSVKTSKRAQLDQALLEALKKHEAEKNAEDTTKT